MKSPRTLLYILKWKWFVSCNKMGFFSMNSIEGRSVSHRDIAESGAITNGYVIRDLLGTNSLDVFSTTVDHVNEYQILFFIVTIFLSLISAKRMPRLKIFKKNCSDIQTKDIPSEKKKYNWRSFKKYLNIDSF